MAVETDQPCGLAAQSFVLLARVCTCLGGRVFLDGQMDAMLGALREASRSSSSGLLAAARAFAFSCRLMRRDPRRPADDFRDLAIEGADGRSDERLAYFGRKRHAPEDGVGVTAWCEQR